MRVTVTLACTECGDRNYTSTKNKKTHPGRLESRRQEMANAANACPVNRTCIQISYIMGLNKRAPCSMIRWARER